MVLLSCGSFNPPTIMHLRMFELAADALRRVSPRVSIRPLLCTRRSAGQCPPCTTCCWLMASHWRPFMCAAVDSGPDFGCG